MFYLLALNGLTLIGPYCAARRTLNCERSWQWGIVGLTIIYWFCVITASGLLMGLVFGKCTSPMFAVTALCMSTVPWAVGQRFMQQDNSVVESKRGHELAWLELFPLLALSAAVMAWSLFALDILPARIWETLNYRGVMVGMWMQGEPLRGFESSSVAAFTFPGNTELLQLWWCIHPHSERWIEMPQWLAAIALADIVGLLAQDLRIPPSGCWWAAALTLTIPVVAVQAATDQNDLTTAAAFAGGLIFIRRWIYEPPEKGVNHAFAAGASMGFALGSKVVVIPFLVPVLIWIFFSWRRCLRSSPAFALPFLALGFYFYADNLMRFGNPLYPFPVKLFGFTLFAPDLTRGMPEFVPGVGNLLTHLAHAPAEWFETHANVPAYSEAIGFGGVWPAIILPAICAVVIERMSGTPNQRRGFWALACVVVMGEVMMWSNTLWTSFDLRYSMHLPALGAVPAALCMSRCRQPWRGIMCGLAIVFGAWTCGNVIANNWNSEISRVLELRRLPADQRTYARLNTMPEARLFATLDGDGIQAESKSVALLTPLSALRSPAFGQSFQRRVWMPDFLRMKGEAGYKRWFHEVEARQIDTVLVINSADCKYGLSDGAREDLANPLRWEQVFSESTTSLQMLAFRRVFGKDEK